MLYLLHFAPRYRHAGHYLGYTARDRLDDRLAEHYAGGSKASPLIRAAMRSGSVVTVARVWPAGDRKLERRLKNRGGLSRQCPTCKAEQNPTTKGV